MRIQDHYPPTLVSLVLNIKRQSWQPEEAEAVMPAHMIYTDTFVVYYNGNEQYVDGTQLYPRLKLIKSRHRKDANKKH